MRSTLESIQYWFMDHGNIENVSAIGLGIVAIIIVISIYKMLKSFHPTMVVFVVGLLGVGLFLFWVNNRNEPAFMTPVVEAVSGFLPKKGEMKQPNVPGL